jgi:hypothetical protein
MQILFNKDNTETVPGDLHKKEKNPLCDSSTKGGYVQAIKRSILRNVHISAQLADLAVASK